MSLAELAKTGPPATRKGPACSIGTALRTLPETEAVALAEMLNTASGWTSADIARSLADTGYLVVTGVTVARHRRDDCGCTR